MNNEALNHPHDIFFKEIMSKQACLVKENAQDFLSNYLPVEVKALVDLDSLDICKDSFVEKELREYFSDLLYQVNLFGTHRKKGPGEADRKKECGRADRKKESGYLYLLFEHKSTPERWIAFHLLRYQIRIWELYLKQNSRARKLPVIIPLVLYHGQGRWKVGTGLYDLITPHRPELKPYVPDFSYLLYDLSTYSDDQIIGMVILRICLLLLKHIHHPEVAVYLEQILSMFSDIAQPEQDNYLATVLRYIYSATDRVSVDDLKRIVEKNISKDKEGMIMTLAEQLIQQGMQKGVQQGIQQGVQQGMQKGLQEAIIDVLETRFSYVPASIREKLAGIADRAALEDVLRKAVTVTSLAELENFF